MAQPYIGEIRLFAGNYAPVGWLLCQGQIVSIADNEALFALLDTTYGGNGQTTFGLPNLQGKLPVGQGQGPGLTNRLIGQQIGVDNVTLTT
ncbi:tail collar protein, partial [Ralstonia sp. A12]|uniref:phage tail protein n=1 Tax=Ralstonia sp. A12 TaxID=1217052 RepID=UPI0005743DC8